MLVLSRKLNEKLIIVLPDGTRIALQVVRATAGKARIGIDAPPDVKVFREELLEAGEQE
jgi:carbon storage regulator